MITIKEEEYLVTEKMKKKVEQVQKEIQRISKQLNTYPEGKLVSIRNGNWYKYYVSDGHTKTYIPAEKRELARQLAWKKYLTCFLEDLEQEKCAIEAYLHKMSKKKHIDRLIEKNQGCIALLGERIKTRNQVIEDWLMEEYETNQEFPETLRHNTIAGHMVRSKSEAMITSYLYSNQIPYRYECALTLEGVTLYPDFTIRHPKTGQIYYWEHFGKMDDEKYVKKTQRKFQIYTSNGIIPTIQLITTYETKENPLDMRTIEEVIEKYFK